MSSPYGPAGGYPQWGQAPPGAGMHPGGYPAAPPGYAPQPPQPHGNPYLGHQPPPFATAPGFGAPPPPKRRSPLPWVLGGLGAVLVVAVVLVLGFVTPGWFVRSVFDASSVEKGVTDILRHSYRLGGVGQVSCPPDQPVEPGHHFDCTASVGAEQKTVTVTVKNDKGVYEVGHPK